MKQIINKEKQDEEKSEWIIKKQALILKRGISPLN